MELQEYHVKHIFKMAGLPVLDGHISYTPEEAVSIASRLGKGPYFLKAQIVGKSTCYGTLLPVGSRDNGCACVATKDDVFNTTRDLLGHPSWLKTASPLFEVNKVYVEKGVINAKEIGQLIFRVNFEKQCIYLTLKPTNKKMISFVLKEGLSPEILAKASSVFGKSLESKIGTLLKRTYHLFQAYGAVAIELSPIVQLTDGSLKIIDGRLVFDPDALYKFPQITPLIESRVGKEQERLARQNHFRYMGIGGNIACVVNGMGLGWATLDLIHRKGGKVGALLDIGTEPSKETVTKALKLVLSEPNVDGVLVNIFGGVTRCDLIAEGLIAASPEMAVNLPFVVRMDGMNAEMGQRLLFESRLPFTVKTKMDEAIRAIIKEVKERR